MDPNTLLSELKIDQHRLDKELIEQPQKYAEWALRLCKATENKDTTKKDLDLIRAVAEKKIRENPEKYGTNGKQTEGQIKTLISLNLRVQKYNALYLKASHEEQVLSKIEKAFSFRKKSLSDLVQLNTQLFFSEPKIQQRKEEEERENKNTRVELKKTLKQSYRSIKRRK